MDTAVKEKIALKIESIGPETFDEIWPIIRDVAARGDTVYFPTDITPEDAKKLWFAPGMHLYGAYSEGRMLGTFYLKANQPWLGDHVANAGYLVSPAAQGLGIGRAMGEFSIPEAKRLGFRAMQFNLVVATNTKAVALWESLGFQKMAKMPGVFRHKELGEVDAWIMFRKL